MPTHLTFSFGIGEYFSFGFDFFPQRPSSPVKLPPVFHGDWDVPKNTVQLDDADKPVVPRDQSACPLFTTLPIEIRHMIWRHLLTVSQPIEKVHKHLGTKDTALIDNYQPIPNIDAAILRTCRLVYSECLPMLYGQNTFSFATPSSIRSFQNKSLMLHPLAFNFKSAPMGRLMMLRNVILKLDGEYRWHNPIGANGRAVPNRDHIWRDWSTTLFSESDDLCPWSGRNALSFPALERLTLDFSEWQLTESEGLLVKPFIKKLGVSGGLQELVLKEVRHQPTIEQFRAGLVEDGGVFRVENT